MMTLTLIQRYRVTRPVLLELIDLVDDDIAPYTRRSRAVPTSLQVCVALRFLATGTYQLGNGDMAFGLSQPTVSRIITRVTTALRKKAQQIISFPRTLAQQEREREGFYTDRRYWLYRWFASTHKDSLRKREWIRLQETVPRNQHSGRMYA